MQKTKNLDFDTMVRLTSTSSVSQAEAASPARGATSTLVRDRLLKDFFRGVYTPGIKLRTEELAQRYAVSRTPVREALISLEREGVLTSTANTGFEVRSPSLKELFELYEIREALESLAVSKLAEKGASPELLAQLTACCERRRDSATFEAMEEGDRMFHSLICDNCGSATLSRLIQQYLVLSSIFNFTKYFVIIQGHGDPRNRRIDQEHQHIVEAIAARDALKAKRLMIRHISGARRHLGLSLKE